MCSKKTSLTWQHKLFKRTKMRTLFQPILSILYFITISCIAICIASLSPLSLLLPETLRYRYITSYSWICIFLAKYMCGINYQVVGRAYLKDNVPSIVMAKHQSMWETLFFQTLLPPQSWILKKELLWIPFFGWGLCCLSPIAIDRKAKHALKSILKQAQKKLSKNWWVIVFPEGTRVKPGETKKFTHTAAFIAKHTQARVVPITHDAGKYWPKGALLLKPGTIKVTIGEPFYPKQLSVREINDRVETWINDNS